MHVHEQVGRVCVCVCVAKCSLDLSGHYQRRANGVQYVAGGLERKRQVFGITVCNELHVILRGADEDADAHPATPVLALLAPVATTSTHRSRNESASMHVEHPCPNSLGPQIAAVVPMMCATPATGANAWTRATSWHMPRTSSSPEYRYSSETGG